MNIKKLFIGGIVAGIVYHLLGWLAYMKLLADYFAKHAGTAKDINRAEPIMLYIIIANLLMGFLLSYIFVKGKISSFGEGLVTGGIVGALMAGATDGILYATTTTVSRMGSLADIITFAILSAIAGAIAAPVSGKN